MLVGEMLLGPVGLLAGLAASFAGRKRVAVTWVRREEEPATEPQAADSIALG
jgi:threonine dehydrogenase-like Zn-dependent dehydrogenase